MTLFILDVFFYSIFGVIFADVPIYPRHSLTQSQNQSTGAIAIKKQFLFYSHLKDGICDNWSQRVLIISGDVVNP